MPTFHPMTLTVGDLVRPVDLGAVTAAQTALLAGALGVDGSDLIAVYNDPEGPHEVRAVVGLVACAFWQERAAVDLALISESITLATHVLVEVHEPDEPATSDVPATPSPEPSPDAIDAAIALLKANDIAVEAPYPDIPIPD